MLPAMVLCAGFGTRLRPLTDVIPKPLLPLGDRPAVLHILRELIGARLGPIVMNTHHRAEAFEGVLPANVRILHEPRILGTAGGVTNAAPFLGTGDALVWNGDVVTEPDLEALVAHHRAPGRRAATLLAVPRAVGEGTLGLDASGDLVRLRGEFFGQEHSGADFVGIQVISAQLRARLPVEGCLVGDGYLPALRAGERIAVCLSDWPWDDIGTPRALLHANLRWLRRSGRTSWCPSPIDKAITLDRTVVCQGAQLSGQGVVSECLVLSGARLAAPANRVIAMADGRVIALG